MRKTDSPAGWGAGGVCAFAELPGRRKLRGGSHSGMGLGPWTCAVAPSPRRSRAFRTEALQEFLLLHQLAFSMDILHLVASAPSEVDLTHILPQPLLSFKSMSSFTWIENSLLIDLPVSALDSHIHFST